MAAPGPAMIYRPAEAGDAAALAACIAAAYAEARARIAGLPDVAAGVDDDIARHWSCVAVQQGRIVGGVIADLGQGKLVNVAVDPGAAGQGIGGELIARAEAACRSAGHVRMVLTTHRDMPENVSLYRHLGWTVSAREGDRVHMEKELGP